MQTGARFVIVAAPRTGSNHLCDRLRAQPDVWCHGEVFHPKRVWVRVEKDTAHIDAETETSLGSLRATDRDQFLAAVFALNQNRPHVGFKIFPGHGLNEVARLIEDRSLAKVILWRENFLAVYASRLAAKSTGVFSATEMTPVKRPVVMFDGGAFETMRTAYDHHYTRALEQLAATGQAFHRIAYTEINSPARIGALLDFIGADTRMADVASPDVRGSPDILSRFSNPEAVQAHLRQHDLTRWAFEAADIS